MNDTFRSCQNVIHPASGRKAMDLACGAFGVAGCTPRRYGNCCYKQISSHSIFVLDGSIIWVIQI